jgi:hypothetical protein
VSTETCSTAKFWAELLRAEVATNKASVREKRALIRVANFFTRDGIKEEGAIPPVNSKPEVFVAFTKELSAHSDFTLPKVLFVHSQALATRQKV